MNGTEREFELVGDSDEIEGESDGHHWHWHDCAGHHEAADPRVATRALVQAAADKAGDAGGERITHNKRGGCVS